jgi:hypothetical protein
MLSLRRCIGSATNTNGLRLAAGRYAGHIPGQGVSQVQVQHQHERTRNL